MSVGVEEDSAANNNLSRVATKEYIAVAAIRI